MQRFSMMRLLSLVSLLFALIPGTAFAEGTIVWMAPELSPYYMRTPHGPAGISYRIEQLLIDNLPEYAHELVVANPLRIFKTMREEENVCSVTVGRTRERQEMFHMSVVNLTGPPDGVVLLKTTLAKLGGNVDTLSLRALLDREDLVLGVNHVAYSGAAVAAILKEKERKNVTYLSTSPTMTGSYLSMLIHGCFDYALGHPFTVLYAAREMGISDDIAIVPVIENRDYLDAGVACSKSAFGKGVIEKIDHILRKERNTEEYINFFRPYVPEKYLDSFLKHYAAVVSE